MPPPVDVEFRRVTDDDLVLLHGWLNEPGIVRWWEGDDVSWDAVVREYGSASTDPTEHWVASADGRDIGWIQCYATASYRDEEEVRQWWALGVAQTAAGIDYLIGAPADRGRGYGSAMIAAFVPLMFQAHPDWTHVAASPVAANTASWRALEKTGFAFAGEFDSRFGPCRLMLRAR